MYLFHENLENPAHDGHPIDHHANLISLNVYRFSGFDTSLLHFEISLTTLG